MSEHTGVMIALAVPNPERYALDPASPSVPVGSEVVPAPELHLTLAFLGSSEDLAPEQIEALRDACRALAESTVAPTALFPASAGVFPPDPDQATTQDGETYEVPTAPFWLAPQPVDQIASLREDLLVHLGARGVGDLVSTRHPVFNPHVTLAYAPLGQPVLAELPTPVPVEFDRLVLAVAGVWEEFPLQRASDPTRVPPPLTASVERALAAVSSQSPGFSADLLRAVYLRQRPAASPVASRSDQAMQAVREYVRETTRAGLAAAALPGWDPKALSSRAPRLSELINRAAIEPDPTARALTLARALALAARIPGRDGDAVRHRLRALTADGNSSAARSLRARAQLRDRKGRWIEMGGGVRFKVRTPGAGSKWYHGTVEGIDVPNGLVTVRLDEGAGDKAGKLVNVPNDKLEQPKAILGWRPKSSGKKGTKAPSYRPWSPDRPVVTGPAADEAPSSWSEFKDWLGGKTKVTLDTETTGFDVEEGGDDMPVQLAATRVRPDGSEDSFNTLVNPGKPIPPESTAVHGITDEMVAGAPSPAEAFEQFRQWAEQSDNNLLVAHNMNFDEAAVSAMSPEAKAWMDGQSSLDTFRLARAAVPKKDQGGPAESHALATLAPAFNIDTGTSHTADADAKAASDLLPKLVDYAVDHERPAAALQNLPAQGAEFKQKMPAYLQELYGWKQANSSEAEAYSDPNAPDPDAEAIAALENVYAEVTAKHPDAKVSGGNIVNLVNDPNLKAAEADNPGQDSYTFTASRNPIKDQPITLQSSDIASVRESISRITEGNMPDGFDDLDEAGKKKAAQAAAGKAYGQLAAQFNERNDDPELKSAPGVKEADLQEVDSAADDPGNVDGPTDTELQDAALDALKELKKRVSSKSPFAKQRDRVAKSLETSVARFKSGEDDREEFLKNLDQIKNFANAQEPSWGAKPGNDGEHFSALAEDLDNIHQAAGGDDATDRAKAAAQDLANLAEDATSFEDDNGPIGWTDDLESFHGYATDIVNGIESGKYAGDPERLERDVAALEELRNSVDNVIDEGEMDAALADLRANADAMKTKAAAPEQAPTPEKDAVAPTPAPEPAPEETEADAPDVPGEPEDYTPDYSPTPEVQAAWEARDEVYGAVADALTPDGETEQADSFPEAVSSALDDFQSTLEAWDTLPEDAESLGGYADQVKERGAAVIDAIGNDPSVSQEKAQAVKDAVDSFASAVQDAADVADVADGPDVPEESASPEGDTNAAQFLGLYDQLNDIAKANPQVSEPVSAIGNAVANIGKELQSGSLSGAQAGKLLDGLVTEVDGLYDDPIYGKHLDGTDAGDDLDAVRDDLLGLAQKAKAGELGGSQGGTDAPEGVSEDLFDASSASREALADLAEVSPQPKNQPGKKALAAWNEMLDAIEGGEQVDPEEAQKLHDALVKSLEADSWGKKGKTYSDGDLAPVRESGQALVDSLPAKGAEAPEAEADEPAPEPSAPEVPEPEQPADTGWMSEADYETMRDEASLHAPLFVDDPDMTPDETELMKAIDQAYDGQIDEGELAGIFLELADQVDPGDMTPSNGDEAMWADKGKDAADWLRGTAAELHPDAAEAVGAEKPVADTSADAVPDTPVPTEGFTAENAISALEYTENTAGDNLDEKLAEAVAMRDSGEMDNSDLADAIDGIRDELFERYGQNAATKWIGEYLDGYAAQVRDEPEPEPKAAEKADVSVQADNLSSAIESAIEYANYEPDYESGQGAGFAPDQELIDAADGMKAAFDEAEGARAAGTMTDAQAAELVKTAYEAYDEAVLNMSEGEYGADPALESAAYGYVEALDPSQAAPEASGPPADPWASSDFPDPWSEVQLKESAKKLAESDSPVLQAVGEHIQNSLAGEAPADPGDLAGTDLPGDPTLEAGALSDFLEWTAQSDELDQATKAEFVDAAEELDGVGEGPTQDQIDEMYDTWSSDVRAILDADPSTKAALDEMGDEGFWEWVTDENLTPWTDPQEAASWFKEKHGEIPDTPEQSKAKAPAATFDPNHDWSQYEKPGENYDDEPIDNWTALYGYATDYSDDINGMLRDPDSAPDGNTLAMAQDLDSMMEHSTVEADTTTARIAVGPTSADWMQALMNAEVGETIVDPGFSSTSKNDDTTDWNKSPAAIAGKEQARVTFKIDVPAGTRAIDVNEMLANAFGTPNPMEGEYELLLDRGTGFTVTDKQVSEDGRAIMLSVTAVQNGVQQQEVKTDDGAEEPQPADGAADDGGGAGSPEGGVGPAEVPAPAAAGAGQLGELSDLSQPVHNVDDWEKVGGNLGGGAVGGTYEAPDGTRYYVKSVDSPAHVHNEVLHSLLYRDLGVNAAVVEPGTLKGQLVVVSKWVPGNEGETAKDKIAANDQDWIEKAYDGFTLDAWTTNWDAVGPTQGNIVVGKDEDGNEVPYRIDGGGALLFSGFGNPKGAKFGPKVTELDSMRDPDRSAGKLFHGMTDEQVKADAAKLATLTPERLRALIDSTGFDKQTKDKLYLTLFARQTDLLAQTGAVKPSDPAMPAVVKATKAADVKKADITADAPNEEAADAIAAADNGTEPANLWVNADGVQLKLGDKVVSNSDGAAGTVVSLSANGKYAKVLPAGQEKLAPKDRKYIFRFPHTLKLQQESEPAQVADPENDGQIVPFEEPVDPAPFGEAPKDLLGLLDQFAFNNAGVESDGVDIGDNAYETYYSVVNGETSPQDGYDILTDMLGDAGESASPTAQADLQQIADMVKELPDLTDGDPIEEDEEAIAEAEAPEVPQSAAPDPAGAEEDGLQFFQVTANNAVPGMVNKKGETLLKIQPATENGKPVWWAFVGDPNDLESQKKLVWKKYSGIGQWATPSTAVPQAVEPAPEAAPEPSAPEAPSVPDPVEEPLADWEKELLGYPVEEPAPQGQAQLGPKYAAMPDGSKPVMQMADKVGKDTGPVLVIHPDGSLQAYTADGSVSKAYTSLEKYQANPKWASYQPGPSAGQSAPAAPAPLNPEAPEGAAAQMVGEAKQALVSLSGSLDGYYSDDYGDIGAGISQLMDLHSDGEKTGDEVYQELLQATEAAKYSKGADGEELTTDQHLALIDAVNDWKAAIDAETDQNVQTTAPAAPGTPENPSNANTPAKQAVEKAAEPLIGFVHPDFGDVGQNIGQALLMNSEGSMTDAELVEYLGDAINATGDAKDAEGNGPEADLLVPLGEAVDALTGPSAGVGESSPAVHPANAFAQMNGPSHLGAFGAELYVGTKVQSTSGDISGTVIGFSNDGKYAKVMVPGQPKAKLRYPSKLKYDPAAGGAVAPGAAPDKPGIPGGTQLAPNSIPTPDPGVKYVQGNADPDSPLYGEENKPQPPAAPETPAAQALGDEWFAKVEAAYQEKQGKPLSDSSKLATYNQAKSGSVAALDQLKNKGWISQELYDEGKAQIDANLAETQKVLDEHAAKVAQHQADLAEWAKANGKTGVSLLGFDAPSVMKLGIADAKSVMNNQHKPANLTASQKAAVQAQKSSSSWQTPLRKTLKKETLDPSKVSQQVKNLDQAVQAAPPLAEDMVMVRTLTPTSFVLPGMTREQMRESANFPKIQGTVQIDWGFPESSPGSMEAGAVPGFQVGNVWMDILMPKGTRGVWTGGGGYSHTGERGFVAERGLAYYIHKAEWRTDLPGANGQGKWYVQAEVLPKLGDYGGDYYDIFEQGTPIDTVIGTPNGLIEGGIAPIPGAPGTPGAPAAPEGDGGAAPSAGV